MTSQKPLSSQDFFPHTLTLSYFRYLVFDYRISKNELNEHFSLVLTHFRKFFDNARCHPSTTS